MKHQPKEETRLAPQFNIIIARIQTYGNLNKSKVVGLILDKYIQMLYTKANKTTGEMKMKKDIELKKSERTQVWKENNPSERYEETINRLEVWFCGELIGYIEGSKKSYSYYSADAKYFYNSAYCPKRKWAIQSLISEVKDIQVNLI